MITKYQPVHAETLAGSLIRFSGESTIAAVSSPDQVEKPSMRSRILIILGLAFAALAGPQPAEAASLLAFDKSSYVVGASQTVQVQVFLLQTSGTPQVGPGNELTSAGFVVSFNSPSGVAAVVSINNITPSPAFDVTSASVTSTQATLQELAITLPGISSLPGLLATFRFTPLSLGTTQISVAPITPGPSFSTIKGDTLSPSSATASITVIPEPPSIVIVMTAVPVLFGGLALRRNRLRARLVS